MKSKKEYVAFKKFIVVHTYDSVEVRINKSDILSALNLKEQVTIEIVKTN
jgi:hypothetical protein